MGSLWRTIWLYLRIVMLLLIVVFALTMFFINISSEGPARILPWMDRNSNVLALLAAFILGVLLVPLVRTINITWRDYRDDKQRRHEENAEAALRQFNAQQRRQKNAEDGRTPVSDQSDSTQA